MSEDLILTTKVSKQLSTDTAKLSSRAINEAIKDGTIDGYIQYSTSGRYRFYVHVDKIPEVQKAWREGRLGSIGGWSVPEKFDPKKHGDLIKDYEEKMVKARSERGK